ncbi:hypothetical protein ZWY2020_053607 [Hordeum vulgare]|nr:hypothetical protein ZWY2020_053607 [Hordeum vulgare]
MGMSHPTLEPWTAGSLVAAHDRGEDRHRGRWLEKKNVAGTGTEVRSPAIGKRLDVEGRIPKPCRIVGDEGEGTEEDLMTHAQISAGRHDEKSFNDYVSRQLEQNACILSHLSACVDRNVNDLKLLSKHASMVTTQVEQVLKAQNDLLNELNDNSVRVVTRGGRMTQEPLYPEGHPKRVVQDSQGVSTDAPSHPRKKKNDDRNLHTSNCVAATPESPNDVSVSNAETQSGDKHEPDDNINSDVHEDVQPSNEKDVEIEPDLDNPQPKNRRYDKNDCAAMKHGKEREPWVQKPMPFPPKPSKKKDDKDFERFVEMIRPVFLQMRLTDMLKMSLYAKYMKDIVTNKRRIPQILPPPHVLLVASPGTSSLLIDVHGSMAAFMEEERAVNEALGYPKAHARLCRAGARGGVL